jgi:hypothetical protein
MNTSNLMLVVSFDEASNAYKPAFHNLSSEAAREQIRTFEQEKIRAIMLAQGRQHRNSVGKNCRACKEAARKAASLNDHQFGGHDESISSIEGAQTEVD